MRVTQRRRVAQVSFDPRTVTSWTWVAASRAIEVYRSLRFDYAQRIVSPAVQDALKATIATYAAGEIVPHRRDVSRDLQRELAPRLERFGLRLDAIATTRLNFAYSYARAAQAKVVAIQRTLGTEQDLQRVRFESQQSVIRAESEVRALRLQRIPVPELVRLRELELQRRDRQVGRSSPADDDGTTVSGADAGWQSRLTSGGRDGPVVSAPAHG